MHCRWTPHQTQGPPMHRWLPTAIWCGLLSILHPGNYLDHCLTHPTIICVTQLTLPSSQFHASLSSSRHRCSSLPPHACQLDLQRWTWKHWLLLRAYKEPLWNQTGCPWLVPTPMWWSTYTMFQTKYNQPLSFLLKWLHPLYLHGWLPHFWTLGSSSSECYQIPTKQFPTERQGRSQGLPWNMCSSWSHCLHHYTNSARPHQLHAHRPWPPVIRQLPHPAQVHTCHIYPPFWHWWCLAWRTLALSFNHWQTELHCS